MDNKQQPWLTAFLVLIGVVAAFSIGLQFGQYTSDAKHKGSFKKSSAIEVSEVMPPSPDPDSKITIQGYSADSNTVLFVTGGSSTCPPVIDDVVRMDNQVILKMKSYKEQVCTMDYKTTAFEITFPGADLPSDISLYTVENGELVAQGKR